LNRLATATTTANRCPILSTSPLKNLLQRELKDSFLALQEAEAQAILTAAQAKEVALEAEVLAL